LLAILDHVVAEEASRKVVVRSDDACKARDAGNREKQIFSDFLSVFHYLNYF
jgi:hypothetical protein